MRRLPLALLLLAVCLSSGCTTKHMALEAEALIALPLTPVGVATGWDLKRTQKYTVPRQVSPGWIEVAIGLPFTGLILPSWENDREYTKEEKRYPAWWRSRVSKQVRVRSKKEKKRQAYVIDGTSDGATLE